MSEYEPVLIEILVEVMDPSFVCLVSSSGRLCVEGRLGDSGRVLGWGWEDRLLGP